MTLNAKAAIVLCLGFVGGLSWLLHGAAPPPTTRPSPLVAGRGAARGLARGGAVRQPVPDTDLDRWERWTRQFEREHAVVRELASHRSDALALAYVPAINVAGPAVAPPALVYDRAGAGSADELVVVAAEQPEEPTAAGQGVAPVDVPAGKMAAAGLSPPRRYRVARGDTLMKLVRREWDSSDARLVELLVAANPQLSGRRNRILVGEELLLPSEAVARRVLEGGWKPAEGVAGQLAAAAEDATARVRWYTIKKNDSLTSIARRFLNDGRRWREILELNEALDSDKIFPGVRIKLPPAIRLASGQVASSR